VFAWLLSLHPTAAGRVYAAYGGVYIPVAILWLWLVDSVRPTAWDIVGVAVCLLGMGIIIWGARPASSLLRRPSQNFTLCVTPPGDVLRRLRG